MRSYGDITLKYLKKNKKRTFFTVIGIILSLSLISGLGFLYYSFQDLLVNRIKTFNGDFEARYMMVNNNQINIIKNDVDLDKIGIVEYNFDTIENNKEHKISLKKYDKTAMNEVFTTILTEGELPKNSKEIILAKEAKQPLGVKIGDEISLINNSDGEKSTYKIVGFRDHNMYSGKNYDGYTLLDNPNEKELLDVYFTLKDKKGKVELVEEKAKKLNVSLDSIEFNNELLAFRGESSYTGINTLIKLMTIFVLLIISSATIFLIYNTINISVTERIKEFGILRSIGGTPKQIRNIVLKEGFIMCLISLPFGILFGYFGVYTTVLFLKNGLSTMFGTEFMLHFYPIVILITLVIGILTIFIASFGPAKRAGKISPIDILKSDGTEVEKGKIKYSKGTLIKKIFGLEGWVAYKNIRKNKKRFIITILSISTSLIMFIIFNIMNIKQNNELEYLKKQSVTDAKLHVDRKDENKVTEEIKSIDGIDKVYTFYENTNPLLISKNNLSERYLKDNVTKTEDINNEYALLYPAVIYKYNNDALSTIGLSKEDLGDNGIVIINSIKNTNEEGRIEQYDITNYKIGDTIKLPKSMFEYIENITTKSLDDYVDSNEYNQRLLKEMKNNEVFEFKVKGIIPCNLLRATNNSQLGVIIPEALYDKLDKDKVTSAEVSVKFTDTDDNKAEKMSKELGEIADRNELMCINKYEINKNNKELWTVINVFVYGFIAMITLIGVVNVVNTIAINILLKKKEFGTLEAIGMSRQQLIKMIILEGILHGIIACVIGGISSIILAKIMIVIMNSGVTMSNTIPVMPFIIGFGGVLMITLIASLIPLGKLKKLSIVDSIRDNE